MIGIFKTNIDSPHDKNQVLQALTAKFNATACTVDLEDCDKVLRIECLPMPESHIADFVQQLGFHCSPLE
ncbi:hypothetical protein MKQ68_04175 [Chitinophaga horti]|uniref:Heavy-metal-associated domain-containing protein n=1 Tax=Chitinophaga horti TaxID=2920382 RepID=A0ABY6J3X1_9BACT|nr:hypothetical protein [Chitinophaga horti]UYQ94288.1 hypothetical protein MKQ68_04175 [Chitinophaga horti]